jgi:hypothetical protein
VATTLKEHRLSFALAPDEHLDLDKFLFYSSAVVKRHSGVSCFRMAARRSLGWNWKGSSNRLPASVSTNFEVPGHELSLVYLKREKFLSALQLLGCLLIMPTALKTDSAKSIKIIDGVLGQIGKNLVLDALRLGSQELRNFSVDPSFVSSFNLPKSLYSFGATAVHVAVSRVDPSLAYRTRLKVDGLINEQHQISDEIALEAVKLLSQSALVHLEVLP